LFQIVFISEYEKNLSSLQGFSTIVQTLVRNSKCSDIFGNEKEVQASIQQWLEYIVICIDYANVPANVKRILNVSVIYIHMYKVCISYKKHNNNMSFDYRN